NHLRGGPCRTYIEAVKVQIADDIGEAYYYPDVFVACEPGDDDSHVVHNPKLIIEVLSESTARIDRSDKLTNYKRIPTVEEIVLIEQDWPEILVFRKKSPHAIRDHRTPRLHRLCRAARRVLSEQPLSG
ncbi:MAG: Uma2 family endonuclease, partial [Akkermansiaceae bacterium]|nr:Uma2 family endonuclease [Akkermansiaceae bacterium]